MKYKANSKYAALSDTKSFLAKGSASTHLKLIAGEDVEVHSSLLPLSKELEECLTKIDTSKKGDK